MAARFILPVLLAIGAIASAQDKPDKPPAIKTTILAVALNGQVEGLFYQSKEKVEGFQANRTSLGQPIDYVGPRRFILHKSEAAFVAEPPGPPPAAFVDLPENADRVLLIAEITDGAGVRLVAHDIASTRLQPGDYQFFNFSRHQVLGVMGKNKFSLAPGKTTVASSAAWRDKVMDLEVKLAIATQERAVLVHSSVWGHRPVRRNMVFLFNGQTASKPLEIRRYNDLLPLKAKPAEDTEAAP